MVKISKEELTNIKENLILQKIGIRLKITNSQTWMTTHIISFDVKNIGRTKVPNIFYGLAGNIEKDFSDLNISVKDSKGNHLDIVNIALETRLIKHFLVKLKKPLGPGNKIDKVQLKYDWEEPLRNYSWEVSSICKKFSVVLLIPLEVEPKIRFFKRAKKGEKEILQPKTTIKKKYRQIIWEGKNLLPYDELTFFW